MSLEIDNISVQSEGRLLLKEISFSLKAGEITAVLGSNGAGKSELVQALAGILPIPSGSYRLDQTSLLGSPPHVIRQNGIAAVPEGHRIFTKLSVDDNLRAAGSILEHGLEETLSDAYALFPELAERKGQLAGTMSGGQQQMLALGHALMCKPRFMLIDEMSLGLAPLVVKRLMGFVQDLKARGMGVLLIEQFADLALRASDHALVMRGGKITYSGTAKSLLNDPQALDLAYFGKAHSKA